MNTPILYHNLLVLLATVYPVSLPQIASNFIPRNAAKHSNVIYLASSVAVSGMLLLLGCSLVPLQGQLSLPSGNHWYIVAAILAPLLIGVEFLVGAAALKLSGVRIGGLTVNRNWVKISNLGFFLTIALAVIEELLYRQLWSVILLDNFGLPVWGFLLISSCAYGFNHLYYGFVTFLQKVVSGVFLTLLFVFSGKAILMPIIAHTLQNAIILIWGRCRENE